MVTLPECPVCQSEYVYQDGAVLVCPECSHEWPKDAVEVLDEAAPVTNRCK